MLVLLNFGCYGRKIRKKRLLHANLIESSSHDLALENTLLHFDNDPSHRKEIGRILRQLSTDLDVIHYRQDVFEDLLKHARLAARFRELLPAFDALARYQYPPLEDETILHEVIWRTGELEVLVDCVRGLHEIFAEIDGDIHSAGLRTLHENVDNIFQDVGYQNLVKELPSFLAKLRSSVSITIGVNLDRYLQPYEATLLAVNKERFTGASLLNKLFGKSDKREWEGLAALHSVDDHKGEKRGSSDYAVTNVHFNPKPTMLPLFRDLAGVLEKVCKPILKSLSAYGQVNSRFLINLRKDLIFYLGAIELNERMKSCGLPMCRPEIVAMSERVYEVEENYNINLALHLSDFNRQTNLEEKIVGNDVELGEKGRIMILTGPNQGGKTTYLQAIGLTHILAQAGLHVPGIKARISPVDSIYTHYPVEEQLESGTGRFGDEAKRLNDIFSQATRHSLILLNESLSGTNIGEALYLAQDVVRILCMMATRAIFATHMHELAERAELLNGETSGDSQVISMVASLIHESSFQDGLDDETVKYTYKVVPGPPMGRSYAKELARRYGISFEQLVITLQDRGVIA